MLTATDEPTEESENYFVSMTDMMVGMLFIFIIMLMVFALNFRVGDDDSKRVKDCLTELLMRNAQLSADINTNVNRIQDDVRGQIEALELAADHRKRLLADINRRLIEQDIKAEIDERNGVLRLPETAVKFEPGRSDLDSLARYNIGRIGRILAGVVADHAACRGSVPTEACKTFQGRAWRRSSSRGIPIRPASRTLPNATVGTGCFRRSGPPRPIGRSWPAPLTCANSAIAAANRSSRSRATPPPGPSPQETTRRSGLATGASTCVS